MQAAISRPKTRDPIPQPSLAARSSPQSGSVAGSHGHGVPNPYTESYAENVQRLVATGDAPCWAGDFFNVFFRVGHGAGAAPGVGRAD